MVLSNLMFPLWGTFGGTLINLIGTGVPFGGEPFVPPQNVVYAQQYGKPQQSANYGNYSGGGNDPNSVYAYPNNQGGGPRLSAERKRSDMIGLVQRLHIS